MGQDWNIKVRGHECYASREPFTEGCEVFSRLVFVEEGYVREDYSREHWNDGLKEQAVSVWKNIYTVPPIESDDKIVKKETAESLLYQLLEAEDESNQSVIFILAVMLERQRILVERDVIHQEDRGKVRVYEHRRSGESFLIPDPELKLAELESVQNAVMQRLGISGPEKPDQQTDMGQEATPGSSPGSEAN